MSREENSCQRRYDLAMAYLERFQATQRHLSQAPYDVSINVDGLEKDEARQASLYRNAAKDYLQCFDSHGTLPTISTTMETYWAESEKREKRLREKRMYSWIHDNL